MSKKLFNEILKTVVNSSPTANINNDENAPEKPYSQLETEMSIKSLRDAKI